MKEKGESSVFTVDVLIDETDDRTQAEAILSFGDERYTGWGRARRNPSDPSVPRVGEELAVARALNDLSHKLLEAAARAIEEFEGRPVTVHG